jgi:hypothetical protein
MMMMMMVVMMMMMMMTTTTTIYFKGRKLISNCRREPQVLIELHVIEQSMECES